MKILRLSDRIKIKANDLEVTISPLSYAQKIEIANCVAIDSGVQRVDVQKTAMLTLAYSIKDVKGITTFDDKEYELEFTDDSKVMLSDECTSELISTFAPTKLFGVINSVLTGNLDLDIDGVELEVIPKK